MRLRSTRGGAARLLCGLLAPAVGLACGARLLASPDDAPHYLKFVAFEAPGNERVLLRWPKRKMPLKVYAPEPPEGLFEDREAVWSAARSGVMAWSDAAEPGLPALELVDSAPQADIPIAWAGTSPSYSIAHCFYNVRIFQRRFGVAQIVVTGRFRDGTEATPELIREVVIHEMGHALGLGGHSPNREDAMYGFLDAPTDNMPEFLSDRIPKRVGRGLTARDRETIRLLYERPIGARMTGARRAY